MSLCLNLHSGLDKLDRRDHEAVDKTSKHAGRDRLPQSHTLLVLDAMTVFIELVGREDDRVDYRLTD